MTPADSKPETAKLPFLYWVLPEPIAGLTDIGSTAKLVFARLLNWWDTTGNAFPGLRLMAKDCGVSCAAIIRAINELEKAKLIIIKRRENSEPGSNRYTPGSRWKKILERCRNGSAAETEALPKRIRGAAETEAGALPKRTKTAAETDTENSQENYNSELQLRTLNSGQPNLKLSGDVEPNSKSTTIRAFSSEDEFEVMLKQFGMSPRVTHSLTRYFYTMKPREVLRACKSWKRSKAPISELSKAVKEVINHQLHKNQIARERRPKLVAN